MTSAAEALDQPKGTSSRARPGAEAGPRAEQGPIGVIVLNLGTAETPDELPGYIRRLLSDPDVVPLPWPLRQIIGLVAAARRAGPVAEHYRAIGGRSPLHAETRRQIEALRADLGHGWTVRFAFRHSTPYAGAVLDGLRETGTRRLVALPAYPQYSQATTGSGMKVLEREARQRGMELVAVRSYPEAPGYLEALGNATARLVEPGDYVLYSAHGLPQRMVDQGDPYVGEVERTVRAAAARLPAGTPHSLAYQSRVGRMKWTGPYLRDELNRLGREGVESLVIVPVSFVCENLEALYELDLEHGELARAAGIARYRRAPVPGDSPCFIRELAGLCRGQARQAGWEQAHG